MRHKKYGLQIVPIDPATNHIFGSARSLGGTVIQPDGDWTPHLPADEFQDLFGIEPYACATFGTLNCVETLANRLYGFKDNWSDRFLAKNSGTDLRKGNDPHTVAEVLRHEGTPVQAQWDFTPDINTFAKFYAALTSAVKTLALQFTAEYAFGHEYVGTSVAAFREALKYSPLGISVAAWWPNPDGIYSKPPGAGDDNHWCMLYFIEPGTDIGHVFDSYDNSHKKYRLTSVQIAKRYTLTKQTDVQSAGWAAFLVNLVKAAYQLLVPQAPAAPAPTAPSTLPPAPAAPRKDYLGLMCQAIQKHEGWFAGSRSWRNHNPGNCKFSSIGYDKMYGKVGRDADGFAIFSSDTLGMLYLRNLIKGKARANPSQSLANFMKEYAPVEDNNDPVRYATVVGKEMDVNPYTFTIGEIL